MARKAHHEPKPPEAEHETPPVDNDMGPEYDRTTWGSDDATPTKAPTTVIPPDGK